MYRLGSFMFCSLSLFVYVSAMPQDLGNLNREKDVNSRYYSGYGSNGGYYGGSSSYSNGNGGYYGGSSSYSNGGYYPQQTSYNNGGYSSGNNYGNSYNKAGSCPSSSYGRKRRSAEPGSEIEDVNSRYYSNGNYYNGGSSSTYYCNNDHDCSGNLKCCYSYGQRQCSYPHYAGGLGVTSSGIGIGL